MTPEQTVMLAELERSHGKVLRIPDDAPIADQLLCQCVTDTRAYTCENCGVLFTIEPDGECQVWALVPDHS